MSATIFTIAQQKGGAGKTTLVAQLACAFAKAGKTVAMLDIDPQGSLSAWRTVREAQPESKAPPLHLSQIAGWRLRGEIDRLKEAYDIVLVDSPPHAETEAKIAVRAADLLVVPVQPSPMDAWATGATIELAESEDVAHLVVLNRVPPRAKLSDAVRAMLKRDKLPIAKNQLGNRVAFAASMMEGRGVVESHAGSTAAKEITTLAKELLRKA